MDVCFASHHWESGIIVTARGTPRAAAILYFSTLVPLGYLSLSFENLLESNPIFNSFKSFPSSLLLLLLLCTRSGCVVLNYGSKCSNIKRVELIRDEVP